MNEKEKPKGGRRGINLRSKGFYAALYSCVGVMLVLAVVIGYNNFGPGWNKDKANGDDSQALKPDTGYDMNLGLGYDSGQPTDTVETDGDTYGYGEGFGEDSLEVSQQGVEPYLNQADAGQNGLQPPDGYETTLTDEDRQLWQEPGLDWTMGDEYDENMEARGKATPTPSPEQVPSRESSFKPFNDVTDYLAWPLVGDVVMAYSADHLIYDKTLEQYRTNKNVCIGAAEGSPVTAASAGIVKEIYQTRESGKTVVVDHGNGWTTTYSQLQDNVLVKAGDVVETGQQIGAVGSPTMFSSKLGAHLAYAVYKDDSAVDPSTVSR